MNNKVVFIKSQPLLGDAFTSGCLNVCVVYPPNCFHISLLENWSLEQAHEKVRSVKSQDQPLTSGHKEGWHICMLGTPGNGA